MPDHFVFIDDTGDPGPRGSELYGFGILEVPESEYWKIRHLLAEERWRFRLYRDFQLDPTKNPCRNVLVQLAELADHGVAHMSGFYLHKKHYRGRYYTWSDIGSAPASQWPHRLRNYLLRKALEFHYDGRVVDGYSIDVVLDRIALNAKQRENLEAYLASRKGIVLQEPFRLPKIDYVTISDSAYTGGLQLAHVMAELVKKCAAGALGDEADYMLHCFRVAEFLGHEKPQE